MYDKVLTISIIMYGRYSKGINVHIRKKPSPPVDVDMDADKCSYSLHEL